jgi:hypothetical protein
MPTATVSESDSVTSASPSGGAWRRARRILAAERVEAASDMKLAYDSRPAHVWDGIGRYAGCLLDALAQSGRGEIVESRDPQWTWDDVAAATWEVYERAMIAGSGGRRRPRDGARSPISAERVRRS